ncbi:MAG: cell division ATP-binding protein FtsE [Oscillospiraceae bacterium]|nr:cell division ATP-binding protein FtsE [Oscillospiraceae bacterium]
MIKFVNVNKVYPNGTSGLENVNLSIEDGEFVFVVGDSGSGKSTLVKLILTEERHTSGRIYVNDYDLSRIKNRHIPALRRTMGVVFQDFRLIPTMNVYDNVAFALRVTNIPSREIKKRVPYILNLVGLEAKSKAMPTQISGGEQQRVALARALANNPMLLLADEPTGNIDPNLTFEIMELLIEINHAAKTTVLVVTHEQDMVSHFNKRIITINKGRIVSDAPAQKKRRTGLIHSADPAPVSALAEPNAIRRRTVYDW